MSKNSPARRRFHAENYARRNASKLAAQAIHHAAVKRTGKTATAELFRDALAELNREAARGDYALDDLADALDTLTRQHATRLLEQENNQ